MTNKEIEKILNFLDNEKLEELKRYLLTEKKRNNNILRQKAFEKYLTTNIFGLDGSTLPSIYIGSKDNVQIFTNFASIYILNKNFLNMETSYLSFEKNKARKTSHRYKLVSKEEINKYVSKFEEKLGFNEFDILSIESWSVLASTRYDIEYYDEIKQKKIIEIFRKVEIDTADILLDNPKYTIYNDKMPILKAESEIGKAYIIGCKK
ncbi:MAG: hypothetical protein IJE04_02890 [Bacilli bacterium]|nr:hypothetical protein [Bacilli bacterium]